MVLVVSPGDTVSVDGADVFVPAGEVVYLKMWRLLFGEAGSVAGYCCVARAIVVILAKVLALAYGTCVDDFGAAFWAKDKQLRADVWFFLCDVLGFHLHEEKWNEGFCLLFLGMQTTFSKTGLQLCLNANQRSKYLTYVEWFVQRTGCQPASEPGGRLTWSCNALCGRYGRAFLVPCVPLEVEQPAAACPEVVALLLSCPGGRS